MSAPLETIRSSSHPLLKRVRAAAAGRAEGELLIEGDRLVDEALAAGFALEAVLVSADRIERMAELLRAGVAVRAVQAELLAGVSALDTSPGCLGLAREPRPRTLADLPSHADALVAIAAGIQDPGNLGALARTAEAAGAAALLVTRGGCRPWNPKALRGSMGSLLRVPVLEIEPSVASAQELARCGFRQVRARTRGGKAYDAFDWSGRVALWFTGETGGLPGELARVAEDFEAVSIPMRGGTESLNVNAAAAVLLFAARRAGGAA